MRRSDHPSRPIAITCCRFSALKTLAIPAAGAEPTAQVNVSAPGAALAGFQVSINGRFWVSTEAGTSARCPKTTGTAPNGLGVDVQVIAGVLGVQDRVRVLAAIRLWCRQGRVPRR